MLYKLNLILYNVHSYLINFPMFNPYSQQEEPELTICDQCGDYFYYYPGGHDLLEDEKMFCSHKCYEEFNKSK